MVVDIRAQTICSLGTVIEGAISDEALSAGQGLIRCRGQVVIEGLIAPAAGTVVDLAYVRDDRIVRVPRKMRVLSSFADPFRNVTTVQLGDKLVWFADKAPDRVLPNEPPRFPGDADIGDTYTVELDYPDPTSGDPSTMATVEYEFNGICWWPTLSTSNSYRLDSSKVTVGEQNPTRPLDEQLRAPVTIAASTIAAKCLAGMALTSSGLEQLTAHYIEDDAQIVGSFSSTLEQLLANEALVGFLDANEVLRIVPVAQPPDGAGVYIAETDIVEIGPIGQGTIPPDLFELTLTTGTQDTTAPGLVAEPLAPIAYDFTLPRRQQGEEFGISYAEFLQNSQYDYYRLLYKQVTVNVTAAAGCTITTSSGGVSVTVDAEFLGFAALNYTVSDGVNTSASAQCKFEVVEDTSNDTESGLFPFTASLEGTEVSYATGEGNRLTVSYSDGTALIYRTFESFPAAYRKEYYGPYGELLRQVEYKFENAVAAASNAFELLLAAGWEPDNREVAIITETINTYKYVTTTDAPQSESCQINGICEEYLLLPVNPSVGDTAQYGNCYYVWNGNGWAYSPQPGMGLLTQVSSSPPTAYNGLVSSNTEPQLIESVVSTYEDGLYVVGGINWPSGTVPVMPTGVALTEKVVTTYSEDEIPDYKLGANPKIRTTKTEVFKARYKTVEGQQYIAQQVQTLYEAGLVGTGTADQRSLVVLYWATRLLLDSVSTQSESDRVNSAGNVVSNIPTGGVVPRTWDDNNGYQELVEQYRENNALTQELNQLVAERFVSWGTRYGLSLQVAPWVLPLYPLTTFYVEMASVVGAYKANGISIAFSSDGILANCDALLVGGVGGTGTPWFPVPEGTTLPAAPEPVVDGQAVAPNSIAVPEGFDPNAPGDVFDGLPADEEDSLPISLEPEGIISSDPVSYRLFLGVQVGVTAERLDWSLTPVVKDQALGVKSGIAVYKQTRVKPPAAAIAVAGAVPTVSTGASVKPGALNVTIAAEVPVVSGGASVAVPASDIAVAAGDAPIVPRLSTNTAVPAAAIVVGSELPVIATGFSTAVPVVTVTVAGQVPRAGGNLGDNYGLTALIEDDLLELL